jgi:hypothetical protein
MQDIVEASSSSLYYRLLGSSIPNTMSCVPEGQFGSLPRKEWDLWQQVRAENPSKSLSFGDYAIQHPRPSQVGGGLQMRANIRYTVEDKTMVVRGWGPVVIEGKEQYQGLCARLVAQSYFAGADFSWGDGVIAKCARRRGARLAKHVARSRNVASSAACDGPTSGSEAMMIRRDGSARRRYVRKQDHDVGEHIAPPV